MSGVAPVAVDAPPSERVRPALVFVLLLGVQLLTWNGWDVLYDPESMLAVTKALLFEWSVIITEPESGQRKPSVYGIGQSILFVPAVLVAAWVEPPAGMSTFDWERWLASLTNSIVNALLGAVLFAAGRLHGLTVSRALLLGALTVLGTPLWSLTAYQMSEPFTALCMTVATLAVALGSSPRADALAGAAIGMAILTRPVQLVTLPALVGAWAFRVWRGPRPLDARAVARGVAAGSATLLPCLAIYLAYNHARFGTWVMTSYGLAKGPNVLYSGKGGILEGLGVIFFSRDVGLLWFSPVALLGLCALPFLARRHPILGVSLGGVVAAHVLVHARAGLVYGGPFWGPRFVVAVLPLAMLGLIVLLERGGAALALVAVLGIVSTGMGLLGVMHDTINSNRRVTAEMGMIATQLDRLAPTDLVRPAMRPTSETFWPTFTWFGLGLLAVIGLAGAELARRSGSLRPRRHAAALLGAVVLFVLVRERSLPYRVIAGEGESAAVSTRDIPLTEVAAGRASRRARPDHLILTSPRRVSVPVKLPRGVHRFRIRAEAEPPATCALFLGSRMVARGAGERELASIVTQPVHVRRGGKHELVLDLGSSDPGVTVAVTLRAISVETVASRPFRNYVLGRE